MKLDIELPPYRPASAAGPTNDPSATLPRRQRYRYFRPLLAGRRVLDLYCGDGSGAHFLAERAKEVVGIDPSPSAIDWAREHHRRPNLGFQLGEGVPPESSGSFDAIVRFHPLGDTAGLVRFLASCRTRLSPEGFFLGTVEHSKSASTVQETLSKQFPYVEFFRQSSVAPWDLFPGRNEQDPITFVVGSERPLAPILEPYLRPTAIVIPCHGNLRYSNLCIRSVANFTPEPIEVVLVDNGSTDRTAEWTAALQRAFSNIRVITNRDNRGFAPAVNQALATLRGRHAVLLNNDVVVSRGWLARMLLVLRENERCGLVGPLSNHAPSPQKVDALGYGDDLDAMLAGAVRLAIDSAGTGFEVPRLSAFCWLMRRELIDAIGGLDERFAPVFYEDDDYGVRATLAGFRLRVAADVFVHHFGSATVAQIAPDPHTRLQENWNRFKEKWGIPESVGLGPYFPCDKIPPTTFDSKRDFIPLPSTAVTK